MTTSSDARPATPMTCSHDRVRPADFSALSARSLASPTSAASASTAAVRCSTREFNSSGTDRPPALVDRPEPVHFLPQLRYRAAEFADDLAEVVDVCRLWGTILWPAHDGRRHRLCRRTSSTNSPITLVASRVAGT